MTRRNPYARYRPRPGPPPARAWSMSCDRLLARVRAERHGCPYCQQPAGRTCINPATGEELEHQAAHLVRLQLADIEETTTDA